jgi:hypothetical protein
MARKLIPVAAFITLLLIVAAVLRLRSPQQPPPLPSETKPPASRNDGSDAPELGSATLPIADVAAYAELHSKHTTAQQDVRIVEGLVRDYQQSVQRKGSNPPLGFNEEITRALTGRNPLELAFISSMHPAINARGLLCDRWGTPYHFHPVAQDRIEVRSAGPDERLFTADDVTSAPATSAAGLAAEAKPAPTE